MDEHKSIDIGEFSERLSMRIASCLSAFSYDMRVKSLLGILHTSNMARDWSCKRHENETPGIPYNCKETGRTACCCFFYVEILQCRVAS